MRFEMISGKKIPSARGEASGNVLSSYYKSFYPDALPLLITWGEPQITVSCL